ncbi:RHS repeat-associated core domain-containing protein [candidate division WOR-3 bacterium]|nr:RHS repeat-associated core domain-containing protein [candidate division WOR-3 bacterium]
MKYIATTFLILLTTSIAQADYDDPFYDYRGQNSFRQDYSYQPKEKFDPFTGAICLIYTDLYLPGNGGLDLRIMRVYNSNIYRDYYGSSQLVPDSWVGIGWSLHMGRLVNPQDWNFRYLEMPDGSKHKFYSDNSDRNQWISKEYWILKQIGGGWEVLFTNGVRWIFNEQCQGTIPETGGPIPYYPTVTIADPQYNHISISYQVINNQTLINQINDSCNRTIYFYYATTGAMNLDSIEVLGQNGWRRYRYYYDNLGNRSLLRKVRYPCDPSDYYRYKYDYSPGPGFNHELERVYNPWGGYVDYTFISRQIYAYGYLRIYRSLSQRQETPGGHWITNYGMTSNTLDSTVITDPNGTKTHYILYGYDYNPSAGNNWKLGLMVRKRITGNGINLLINNAYNKSPAISNDDYEGPTTNDDYVYVPQLETREITIDNMTYTTNYLSYDAYSQPTEISETGNASRTISRAYWYNTELNIVDRLASKTINYNATSYSTNYSYDDYGQMIAKNVAGVLTNYTYHSNGNPERTTDASGRWIENSEYQYGVLKIINKGDVYSITRTINRTGTIATETDGNGNTTTYTYDKIDRLRGITPSIGDPTIIEYDAYGNYKKVKLGPGWTQYNYDDWGRVDYSQNSVNVKVDYTYDYLGRKTYGSYPYTSTNIGCTFEYDGLDRIKKITNPDGSYSEYTYNQSKVTCRNERAKITEYQYNAFGNLFGDKLLMSVKDALNQTTNYTYNAAGYLTSINAAGNYNRTHHYNNKFFMDWESTPERGQTNYGYDNAGNLTSRTDANGNTTIYTYDNITRLTNTNYPGATYDVSYTYDNADNLTVVTTPSNTMNFTYDAVNRVENKTLNIDGNSFTLNFAYDGRGNITRINYPDNQYVDYTYNNENRILTVPGYINSNITYHPSGGKQSYSTTNGLITTIQYNNRYRIQRITVGNTLISPKVDFVVPRGIFDEGYQYDYIGNLLTVTDYTNSSNNRTFTYDNIDRLKTFNGPWGNGTYNYASNYPIGRRYQEIIGSNTTTYYYSGTTHRLSYTSGANNLIFNYDNNGNTETINIDGSTVDVTKTFRYDYKNKPDSIHVQYESGPMHWYKELIATYNGMGDRVKIRKNIPLPGDGPRTYDTFCYATSPTGEVLYEKRISFGNEYTTKYIYLNGKLLCKVKDDGHKYFYHNDYLGSAKAMTNATGTKVYSWLGYPFGLQYAITGGEYNDYRFTGKKFDDHTGLYYFGARYYCPEIGRFITPDPAGKFEKKNPMTINPYVYCTDNPTKYIDPNGKWRTTHDRYAWPVTQDFANREFISSFAPGVDIANCVFRSLTGDLTLSTKDWILGAVSVVTAFIPGGKLAKISELLKASVNAGPIALNFITKAEASSEVRQDKIIWRIAEKMGIVDADGTIDFKYHRGEFDEIMDFVKELDKHHSTLPENLLENYEEGWYDIYKEETP